MEYILSYMYSMYSEQKKERERGRRAMCTPMYVNMNGGN